MKKVEEKDMRKLLTKEEIKFAKIQGWAIVPMRSTPFKWTNEFESKEDAEKAMKAKASSIRSKIKTYFKRYWWKDAKTIEEVIKEHEIREKEAKKRENKLKKEQEKKENFISSLSAQCGCPLDNEIEKGLHLGKDCPFNIVKIGKKNDIYIREWTYWKEYTKSTSYPRTGRDLNITIKKGWFIKTIGGVVTFINGKIDRNGIACEWVEQGRSIADLTMHKGYLVRGEHIEAKSLEAAKKINADHRAKALAVLVAKRKRDLKKIKELSNIVVTFDMSLKSGNCKAGTQSFVNKLEAELGHPVTELSAYWVLFYGRKFGVEYYAQRAVNYAIATDQKE